MKELTILGCSSQQPTRYRNHGAYFLRWRDEGLLFDPGEGTQRQFIHAEIAPPLVTKIFISHFHGDHCLGVGSMLMRLNLDKVKHPVHCYYPASGKEHFKRLRYGTMYRENIEIIEHPISEAGIVFEDEDFKIEAQFLVHGVDNLGYRVTESDQRRFNKEKLAQLGIKGLQVRRLIEKGKIEVGDSKVSLDEVSSMQKGDIFSIVLDTLYCKGALKLAKGATILLCESTYLEEHEKLADSYKHLTAKGAARIAKEAGALNLVLTHFSARYRDLALFEKEAREIFPNTYIAEDFKKFSFQKTHRNNSIEISCKSSNKTSFSLTS